MTVQDEKIFVKYKSFKENEIRHNIHKKDRNTISMTSRKGECSDRTERT
jgi:hypothetical protein